MSLINIGLSGLNASSAAIATIGNNTANVDTAGYSRQQVQTTASTPISIGVGIGYIGSGTTVSDVRRIYNGYLETQLQNSTALSAEATAFSTQANKIDTMLSDSTTGIAAQLASFFTKMQSVSASATTSAERSALLTQASALSSRFNSIAAQLSSQNDNINTQLKSVADNVNTLTSTIASLNKQITQASAGNTSANSLMDSRNEAVRKLNELIGVKVVENNTGFDVYTGTGQSLVVAGTSYRMDAAPSSTDPTQYNLQVYYGGTPTDVTSVVTGGTIGGLLRYRSDVLTPAFNELGRVSMVLADQVNTQLAQGIDLKGKFGTALFSDINSADAMSQRSVGKVGNTGTGNLNVAITDSSKLTGNDYEVTFTSASAYTVRRLPNGESVGSGTLETTSPPAAATPAGGIEGFSITSLSVGTVAAGDVFKVTPTVNGASGISVIMKDPQDFAAAAPLTAAAGVSNSGTGGFTQPVLTTKPDIYDSTKLLDLQNGLKGATPMRLVMGTASGGIQSYSLVDAQGAPVNDQSGNPITGSIIQGQSNTLKLNIGYTDSSSTQQSFTVEMTVSGTPNANDTFSISLTGAGSSDNRNATALAGLQTARTVGVSGGSVGTSISSAYGQLVSTVGTQAGQGKSDVTATDAVLAQAKTARDGVSGVSLDEEAANLVKYQQYYTASSQIIKAAQTIFSTLINSL
ncbi:flagellar hook-associated protein FlgK [Pseudomonas sp. DTU_2021_1001937_2_SI_NGA_ILE_001]|uniref:flagellar hook-associated protein FlgK n=1 Tax=Pseudomonas sp. DTU_2021_1001937_2_SI_NGA_ILE_001 TaxID=3077589 RepID=UPI0028FC2A7E|nr:flagellar hook-associated protein FlgK [Pseudomonas sp. DTU_2021_1001937_2_SI_NGA_ILE_001]WNW11152.1 flagellar hook-associated protein FlgK [Pseudomonas sp. DTU_2021_1001937_2_SI_NGA_ILE_001]